MRKDGAVRVPAKANGQRLRLTLVPDSAPDFVRNVTAPILALRGDDLPVSALPVDGTYPTGTARYEKRNIAELVPGSPWFVLVPGCAACAGLTR